MKSQLFSQCMVITTHSGAIYALVVECPTCQSGYVMRIPGPASPMPGGLDHRVWRMASINPMPVVGGWTLFENSDIYMACSTIASIVEVSEDELNQLWEAHARW